MEISIFKCTNCQEQWDINKYGGLIPKSFLSGFWYTKNYILDNCPSCYEEKGEGRWIWLRLKLLH